jgi:hypothetical protein
VTAADHPQLTSGPDRQSIDCQRLAPAARLNRPYWNSFIGPTFKAH